MYKTRHIQSYLQTISDHYNVIMITGARQVGKTTLLRHLFADAPIITFDPLEDVHGARQNPQLFLQQTQTPVILDEIQYAPELLPTLKRHIDQHPDKKYFLTGSHNLNMLKSVAESLAGRMIMLSLDTMTLYEQTDTIHESLWLSKYLVNPDLMALKQSIIPATTSSTLLDTMWRGGFPGLLDKPNITVHAYFNTYLRTYIERDIRTTADISSITDFESFVGIMAALTAQEVNNSKLGRQLDINGATAKKWLNLLIQGYQWHEIPAYHGNTLKRIIKKQKGYFSDTGFACYLQQISSPEGLFKHPLRGALFETFIVNSIKALLASSLPSSKLYHWRSDGGAEVDLVISHDGVLYPIEIKMQSQLNKYDARGIKAFRDTYQPHTQVAPGIIIYAGTDCYLIDEDVLVLPWNAVCI